MKSSWKHITWSNLKDEHRNLTLSLNKPSKKDQNQNSSKLTRFKVNMVSLLTRQITSWNLLFKNIGEQKKYEVKFQQLPSPVYTSFENVQFMDTPLNIEELKQVEKSHGESLNYWVGGIMHITVQTCYDLQYLIMRLSGYINAPNRTYFYCYKTWHGISHVPPTWTHHVL